MARDPKKKPAKKKHESPQTHVKRQQASRKRQRKHGEFAAGGGHLHGLFHGAIARQSHNPLSAHKAMQPGDPWWQAREDDDSDAEARKPTFNKKTKAWDPPDNPTEEELRLTDEAAEKTRSAIRRNQKDKRGRDEYIESKKDEFTKDRIPHHVSQKAKEDEINSKKAASKKRPKQGEYGQGSSRAGSRNYSNEEKQRYASERSSLAHLYDPDNTIEARPEETRTGASGRGHGALPWDDEDKARAQAESGGRLGDFKGDLPDGFGESRYEDGKYVPRVERGGEYPPDDWVRTQMDAFNEEYHRLTRNDHMDHESATREAHRIALDYTLAHHGKGVSIDALRRELEPTRFRTERPEELWGRGGVVNQDTGENYDYGRVETDQLWRSHRGTMQGLPKVQGDEPLTMVRGKKRPPTQDIVAQMPPSQQSWLQGQALSPSDLADYAALSYDNFSSDEIMMWLQMPQGNRPERLGVNGPAGSDLRNRKIDQMAAKDSYNRQFKDKGTSKDKYSDGKGTHQSFAYSMQATGVDSLEALRKRFPNASEFDLVNYQHAQREHVTQHMLEANERWAHETRAARVNKKGDKANVEADDKVVIMTTNAGAPTVSVQANSLVGQYIIKKRKRMVVDEKMATRSQVKGEFPRAVRDQHLIEVSTGVSLGVQGRVGLFHNTGWKVGDKRSKGYGKKAPVGATVLRDSTGQPIYDKDGNIRYTEGYTRPFAAGTDRDIGLRIFIG